MIFKHHIAVNFCGTHLKQFSKNSIQKKQQVLAIVTDNAINMARLVEKFNEMDVLPENGANEDGSGLDEVFDSTLSEMMDFSTTTHMRCAVHALQLAIRDSLKEKLVDRLVSKVRHVAITARTPKIDAILKRKLKKGAIIDQATRWGSTYFVIQRFLKLKDALQDWSHPDLSLTDY